MGWVTLDDGQHVWIGRQGRLFPSGPGSRSAVTIGKARAINHARTVAAEHAAIGHKPGEKFSLIQRSATGAKRLVNTGGVTKALFDMKRGDKPGQTSMFDRPGFAGKIEAAAEKARTSAPVKNTELRSKIAAKIAENKRAADVQAQPEKFAKAGDVVQIGTKHIAFDPERFQYKLDTTGAHGVSAELHGVKNWNPESAGVLSVWRDPGNGKTYVINGHHRLDLANRLGVEKITARYIDAPDAATARMKGAITNIAEGRGTPIDAAKVFRESGNSHEMIHKAGIPMTENTARQGSAIAGLSEHLFKKVVNREIPIERAAIIGGSGLSESQQLTVHAMATKAKANNETVKELIDNAKSAPTLKTTSRSLFGDTEEETSLAMHRAKIAANVGGALSGDKKLFALVSKSKHAEALAERGRSHIDVEETGKVSQEAASVMGVFHTLKNRSGPVASELNRASERLHRGENEGQVMREARQNITEHVKNMLQGGAAAFAA
ncbi:MAG: hypothetical protein ACLP7Q_12710 [Isosphaeraceae bacterium]